MKKRRLGTLAQFAILVGVIALGITCYFTTAVYHSGDIAVLKRIKKENDRSGTLNWTGWNYGSWEGVEWSSDERRWSGSKQSPWKTRRVIGLSIQQKKLTGNLSVAGLTELRWFDCFKNRLTALDMGSLKELARLICHENELESLDISRLPRLANLSCSKNRLVSLNPGSSERLEWLKCASNRLEQLDLSAVPFLQTLDCSDNALSALNIAHLQRLTELNCSKNSLSTLDIGMLRNLKKLSCSSNRLAKLDLRDLGNLEKFDCGGNLLTELDAGRLRKLQELSCGRNPLTFLKIFGAPVDRFSADLTLKPGSSLKLFSSREWQAAPRRGEKGLVPENDGKGGTVFTADGEAGGKYSFLSTGDSLTIEIDR